MFLRMAGEKRLESGFLTPDLVNFLLRYLNDENSKDVAGCLDRF
jgi:hypothetical protein